MATAFIKSQGRSFEVTCEPIEVTSLSDRPDPNWTATDSNGHVHSTGDGSYRWVTTEENYDEDTWDADWGPSGEYRCVLCEERVEPGSLPPTGYREFVPGPKRYSVDGVSVPEAEFMSAYEAARLEMERAGELAPPDETDEQRGLRLLTQMRAFVHGGAQQAGLSVDGVMLTVTKD